MRGLFVVMLASGLCMAGCGQAADSPVVADNPVGPSLITSSGSPAAPTAAAGTKAVPFHSELTWTKAVNGGDPGPCQGLHGNPPNGMIYLMRNTNEGVAVSTHLGAGAYENHICLYGTPGTPAAPPRPEGWFADIRWTAANGDVLLATSDFLYWTGIPGRSVAVDKVTFHDGGTGRFAFVAGQGMSYVNAPERTAVYEGTLRYGKKEK